MVIIVFSNCLIWIALFLQCWQFKTVSSPQDHVTIRYVLQSRFLFPAKTRMYQKQNKIMVHIRSIRYLVYNCSLVRNPHKGSQLNQ